MVFIQWNTTCQKKCTATHNTIDKFHNFEWRESDSKEYTLYDSPFLKFQTRQTFMVLKPRALAPGGGTVTGEGRKVEERLVTFCFLTWVCGYSAVTPLWKCTECTFMISALRGASMLYFKKIYLRRQNSLLYRLQKWMTVWTDTASSTSSLRKNIKSKGGRPGFSSKHWTSHCSSLGLIVLSWGRWGVTGGP